MVPAGAEDVDEVLSVGTLLVDCVSASEVELRDGASVEDVLGASEVVEAGWDVSDAGGCEEEVCFSEADELVSLAGSLTVADEEELLSPSSSPGLLDGTAEGVEGASLSACRRIIARLGILCSSHQEPWATQRTATARRSSWKTRVANMMAACMCLCVSDRGECEDVGRRQRRGYGFFFSNRRPSSLHRLRFGFASSGLQSDG